MNYWLILIIVLLFIVLINNIRRINYLKGSVNSNADYIKDLQNHLKKTSSQLEKYKQESENRTSYFNWFIDNYWHNGSNDANRAILILRHGLRFFNFNNKPLKDYNHNIYKYADDITGEIHIKWAGGTKGGKSLFGEKAWNLLNEFTTVEIANLIIDISYLATNEEVKERENIQGCVEAFIKKNPRLQKFWVETSIY